MATVACLVASAGMVSVAVGQQRGHLTQEYHIPLPIESCNEGGCWTENAEVVMDLQWRWIHNKDAYNNCLPGEFWDKDLCPDPHTCAQRCSVEGVDEAGYKENYKARPAERGLYLEFPNAPRTYVLESPDRYKLFRLLNREFTFDVDLSSLPCGMNAALYFIEMPADGDGRSANQVGARHGAGYCDAQCPHMRWIRGQANLNGWDKVQCAENPDGEVKCGGHGGDLGYCCAEMDILEANREAGVFTAHPCTVQGAEVCEGPDQCGDKGQGKTGFCDKDGCGFANFRMGDEKYWGVGSDYAVDTSRPMTVVTQFLTSDGTDTGELVEIKRLYIQDGKSIENGDAKILPGGGNSITNAMCDEQNRVFDEPHYTFRDAGKLKAMGEALNRGMVLSMSIWDDDFFRMLWLDGEKSHYTQDMSKPGIRRGPCPFNYGTHQDMLKHAEENGPMSVTFSNIKYGPLGSTYSLV